jgi:V8-like Glu-specific endopeptidase
MTTSKNGFFRVLSEVLGRLKSSRRLVPVLLICSPILIPIGCKSLNPLSRTKIDSGESINQSSQNKVEGVFHTFTKKAGTSSGGACSGTAVSTNTAITAAHCLYDRGDQVDKNTGKISGKQYCISNAIYKDVCSSELYVPTIYPRLEQSGGRGTDLGWVVFPEGTFKYFFPMNAGTLSVGDNIVMVGYSEEKLADKGNGSKRFGWNQVTSFQTAARSDIFTRYDSRFENVAVSPGDSGGPLIHNCLVSGVASRMTEESNKKSIHTNLTHPDNAALLKSGIGGAYFCGLSGSDPTHCPQEAMYAPKPGVGKTSRDFPCYVPALAQNQTPDSAGAPTPQQPQALPAKPYRIYAALTESNDLLIRADERLSEAFVCSGTSAQAANSCSNKTFATWDGSQFKMRLTLPGSRGSIVFIKIQAKRQRDGVSSAQTIKVTKR